MNATKRERKLRYLRGLRGEKKHAAVSPVVATLILILIAVAAAAALYLWLVAWQGNITGGIGQPGAQSTVSIGGSTSVYPFSQLAATWFQQNNSDIAISDNQGGTGAGMLAVCAGHIDVGAASSPETPAGLIASDGCPSTPGLTVTTIAYDAVDVVIQSANPHGLLSINYDTLTLVYDRASTTTPTLVANTINGVAFPGGYPAAPGTYPAPLAWTLIPAAVNGAVVGTVTQQIESAGVGAGGAACTGFPNDVCAAVPGTSATPCGWAVCASGAGNVVPVARSDASGTTQTFEAKDMGATSATGFSATFAGLGYSGCGSNNLLADCGISVPTSANGNPGVLTAVAASPNNIGYASDGLARTATGIGAAGIVPLDAPGQQGALPVNTGSTVAFGAVVPTTGATGTIAAGITNSATVNQYSGWRPFEFVTLQPPTGEVERFIGFITDPANNIELATVTGEVSLYSV
jgi:ABC-type phosphate transport system substrate-binding protein